MKINREEFFLRIKKEPDFFQKAKLIYYLRKNQEIRIKEIADAVGMQSSYISHILRLLKLPDIIVDGYYSKQVSISHLFILARLHNQQQMMTAYETILSKNLTSAQTEHLIRKILYNITPKSDLISEEEQNIFLEKMKILYEDVDVKVIQSRIAGKIILEMKGDSKKTSKILRELMKKIIEDGVSDEVKEKIFTLR